MKVSSNNILLALLSVSMASAFTVQTPGRVDTSLASSLQQGPPTSSAAPGSYQGPPPPQRQDPATMPVKIQGGSLKTWALRAIDIERVSITLRTDGRPLDADIDLWHGPDNTPNRMRVYVEDGKKRPFNVVVETPRGPNTVAVRNIGQMEFPMDAFVQPNPMDHAGTVDTMLDESKIVQGGAIKTTAFESNVESAHIMIRTDGRPMNCRIELLQGPNNIKQVMEIYIEDGMDRPFYAIIETPGSGNVIRIKNTSTVEFPMSAIVEPYAIGDSDDEADMVLGGDGSPGFAQW